jgi:DNA anti-recombination protein RmuC
MATFTVVYDASVLYPAPLRDLLIQLALTGLFNARWTDEIHNEWMRNVLKNRPDLTLEQLTRTKNLMNASVRDCFDLNSKAICEAAQMQRSRLKNPPKSPDEYLETLVEQGLQQTAARLRDLCDEI